MGDGRSGPGLDRKYRAILLQNNNRKGETWGSQEQGQSEYFKDSKVKRWLGI